MEGKAVPVMLLGDSAFRLSKFLLKPYPHSRVTSEKQRFFNYMLSRTRRVVENAFGHLKARFRRLLRLEVHIENVPIIIRACCVLHNICNDEADEIMHSWLTEVEGLCNTQPQTSTFSGENSETPAAQRDTVADYLWNKRHELG